MVSNPFIGEKRQHDELSIMKVTHFTINYEFEMFT
jgi:hypothetical protein